MDLDWFWRGWLFTTDHVDISLDEVNVFQMNTMNPDVEMAYKKEKDENADVHIGVTRNQSDIKETVNERDDAIDDFYATRDIYKVDALHFQDLCPSWKGSVVNAFVMINCH